MDPELRVYLQKQMHMVWHDFHLNDFKTVLVSDGLHKFLQSRVHAIDQHFATVFRAKHNMILTGIHNVMV